MRFSPVYRLAALLPLLLLSGCAKVPDALSSANARYVEFTMKVAGNINPNYFYFVLIHRTDDYSEAGPVPVVGLPWGNGFAAASQSDAQGFVTAVVYNTSLGGASGYGVYNVPTNSDSTPAAKPYQIGTGVSGFVAIGQPDQYTSPEGDNHTLRFRVNLARLPNPNAKYLKVNFLATNNLPAGADASSPKLWDALGNGGNTSDVSSLNTFVTMEVTQGQYQSSSNSTDPEPQNDVRDHLGSLVDEPSLDITDWSIQVLAQ